MIIEKAFSGPEYTVSVLGSDILPPLEIIPYGNEFYNFSAKYSSNKTKKIMVTDPQIRKSLAKLPIKPFMLMAAHHGLELILFQRIIILVF